jgi:hypothetical protein
MEKNYIITSVSLTPKEKELISLFKLSPTAIIKSKLAELELMSEELPMYKNKMSRLSKKIQIFYDYLEQKDLTAEFMEYEGEREGEDE